jgi:hypothetical protein
MESCPGGAVLQRPAREKVALVSRVSKSRASHGVGACDRMRSQIFMVNRSPFMFLCLAKDSACSPTLPAFTGRVESVHRSVPSRRLMVPAPLQPRQKRGCPGRWFRNGTADLLEVCDVKDQVGFPHKAFFPLRFLGAAPDSRSRPNLLHDPCQLCAAAMSIDCGKLEWDPDFP